MKSANVSPPQHEVAHPEPSVIDIRNHVSRCIPCLPVWFFLAAGSGIWWNVGKSLRLDNVGAFQGERMRFQPMHSKAAEVQTTPFDVHRLPNSAGARIRLGAAQAVVSWLLVRAR